MKNLKIKLLALGILVTVAASSTPAFAAERPANSKVTNSILQSSGSVLYPLNTWGYTKGSDVRFRSQDNVNSSTIDLLQDHTSVWVIGLADNGFAKVKWNGIIGYIYDAYVVW